MLFLEAMRLKPFSGRVLSQVENPNHQVFISHSSEDTWVARQLAGHVQQCGASCFLDEADIEHGDDFDETLASAAKSSNELLLLLTPWSKQRPYIWIEVGMFRAGSKRIVGVLHGISVMEISTDERMPSLLKKLDVVHINEVDSYFEQLRRRVRAMGMKHRAG